MRGARIAVIGGGVAGLVAANEIASRGGQATLFEGTPHLGGRARTRVVDGFCFNQGPHALYLAGALAKALRDFNIPFGGSGPDLAQGLALWGMRPWSFPLGHRVAPLDDSDAAALKQFIACISAENDLAPGTTLLEVLRALPSRARSVVEALVRLTTYVHAPTEIDAKAALEQLRLSFSGTIYVDGGWQVLVDGLDAAARRAGVSTRLSERAVRIRSNGEAIEIDLRGDRTETFAAVILAIPPGSAESLFARSQHLAGAAASVRPVRLMALDVALSALPHLDANFALGMDNPTYLSVHSAVAKLAPQDGALMHVARYVGANETPSADLFDEVRRVADSLQPGWRDQVVHEQRLSGAIVVHDFPRASKGGRRAHYLLNDSPGIFLAGDWVGDVGMLADAAAASARAAAAAAVRFAASHFQVRNFQEQDRGTDAPTGPKHRAEHLG